MFTNSIARRALLVLLLGAFVTFIPQRNAHAAAYRFNTYCYFCLDGPGTCAQDGFVRGEDPEYDGWCDAYCPEADGGTHWAYSGCTDEGCYDGFPRVDCYEYL